MYDINTFAPKLVVGAVAIILLLLGGKSMFHAVPPGHRGISVTLGSVDPDFRKEGLTFKMPMIEKIYDMPIKQITKSGVADCSSRDLQQVVINFNVLFRIPEGKVVTLYQEYQGDPFINLIEPRVQEQLKQVAAHFKAEEIVTRREEVKIQAMEKLKKTLEDLIHINDLVINNIELTTELRQAIEDKQVAEQRAQKKEYELEIAKKDAEIKVVTAEGEAKAIKIKGDALKASPEVIQLEIAKKWDGKAPQSVVTGSGGANVLLPLK